jgi:hypothetical protein
MTTSITKDPCPSSSEYVHVVWQDGHVECRTRSMSHSRSCPHIGPEVSELIRRFAGYRGGPGYAQVDCPCCGSGGLAVHDFATGVWKVTCSGRCSETAILSAAARLPALREPAYWEDHPARALPERYEPRAQSQRRERGSWPSVEFELALRRARAEADAIFDAELAGPGEPILSSLADAESVPKPSILRLPDGSYLLRRGWVHLFHGKPFCGKSPLCYIAIVEVVKAGGRVLLVDYEMGGPGAKALLVELGLSEGQIRAQVLYAYNPHKWTQGKRDQLAGEIETSIPDLVVIDSLSRSMSKAGLDQNDATETDAWFHSLPTWTVDQFGSAVMLIDHTTRNDGPHPSGNIQKTAAPQFHIWVQNVSAFSRDHEDGCSLLVVQKDRSGQRAIGQTVAELRTEVGGSFVLHEVGKPTASGDDMELDLSTMPQAHKVRIEVIEKLRAADAAGLLTKDIIDLSGGADYQSRKKALDWLLNAAQVIRRKEPGTAKGMRYWLTEFAPGDLDE